MTMPEYEINIGDDGTIEARTPDGQYEVRALTIPPHVVKAFVAGVIEHGGDRAYTVEFTVTDQDEPIALAMAQDVLEALVSGLIDAVES